MGGGGGPTVTFKRLVANRETGRQAEVANTVNRKVGRNGKNDGLPKRAAALNRGNGKHPPKSP